MSLITEKDVFMLFLGLLLAGVLEFPCILTMHFLMPKAVLDRYWKLPHFGPVEIAMYTNTIYAPMRTIMLMAVIAFPRWGKKRNVTQAYRLVPRWYRIAAIGLCIWTIAVIVSILAIIIGSNIHEYISGRRVLWPTQIGGKFDWKQTTADLVLIFCVAFVLAKIWWPKHWWPRNREPKAAENAQPSPTLAQLRPPAPQFRTSPPLYILTSYADRDIPYSTIFSRERNGIQAMMVYLSPIDAILDAPNFMDTFSIEPLENLSDSPDFAPVPGGRLSMHLAYGFAAVGERVILKGDAPAALTQLVHFDIAPDASRPFRLQLDTATLTWLERLHADVGMKDYSDAVRMLDDGPYEDLARRHGAVAFLYMKNARKNIKTVRSITHCALYDIFDQRWRFTTVPEDRIRAMFPEMANL